MNYFTLSFLFAISAKIIANYDCPGVGSPLTAELREQFVNAHNTYRAQLVEGSLVNNYGVRLPRAGNIYQVTWNCTLEEQAQKWADQCVFDKSSEESRPWAGENLHVRLTKDMKREWHPIIVEKATTSWWKEHKNYVGNPTNNFSEKLCRESPGEPGVFSQMAWHWVTAIGCGYANCTGKGRNPSDYNTVHVRCQYFPAGNVEFFPVYKEGRKCKSSTDCTTYPGSECNTKNGLCIPPAKPVVDNLLGSVYSL